MAEPIIPAGNAPANSLWRRFRPGGLWRNHDFLKLWAGQTISELGSRITRDGLPLLAVITLSASPVQMGILSAVGSAPVLLVSLFAGVWVDRLRRQPILIGSDLGRALLLGTIPLAAALGWLSMGQLYVVSALVGVLTVFFSVAYLAYLPGLVGRENIVEGNSKLALSGSAAEVAGPGLAGVLIQFFTAPLAILFDALSFVVSAISLAAIRKPEPARRAPETDQTTLREAITGLRMVLGQPLLRALAVADGIDSFFGSFFGVLYGLYAIRVLHFTPVLLGVVIAAGGVGSLLGALLAEWVVRRLGLGKTLIGARWGGIVAALLIPVAAVFPPLSVVIMIAAQFSDVFLTVYDINAVSLRQSITPDHLLGRVNASVSLLTAGIGPLGALVGGLLAEQMGVQQTLYLAVFGSGLGGLWLLLSPVRRLKTFPAVDENRS